MSKNVGFFVVVLKTEKTFICGRRQERIGGTTHAREGSEEDAVLFWS